ncbi:lipoprotein [Acrocarpospora macrocephala]|uniref:Lipoprotein n=1 Tax=Acrocarpospora macrocephala TaxID=150177 RepID=A0A5M3WG93_9ACTN|nr:hypothetical protein [Acrocarpospora macrocephala]GES07309.1 lipoprotein [Acrocarpospora macrocephala]
MRIQHSVLAVIVALSGCASTAPAPATAPTAQSAEINPAGDIPDDTVFVTYRAPDGAYEVKVPEGWARTDQSTGASFTDKLNSVRIETKASTAAPTESSIRAEVPGAQDAVVDTVRRSGGTAVRIVYRADSAPDPVTGKVVRDEVERYEFYSTGTEAILTLSGPVGADNVDPWRTVSESFAWKR